MGQIIQTVIFWVFLVLMKGQTQKKNPLPLKMRRASYFLYIDIDPRDRMAEHKQNIKAIIYQNITYKDTQLCTQNISQVCHLWYILWGVCLRYSFTVYPQMLPKHNTKLLTLLFAHISALILRITICLLLLHQRFWQHILHIITCGVLQRTH
jgi:hypothetical protein